MIRMLGLVTPVLLLVAVVGPAQTPPNDTQLLEGLRNTLNNIKGDLDLLRPLEIAVRLKDIEDRLSKIEGQAQAQPGGDRTTRFYPSDPDALRIADILARLREFDNRLRRLEDRVPAEGDSVRVPARALDTGSIRLRNTSGLSATVFVNGVSYPLSPFGTRTLPFQPAGLFEYEVEVEGFGQIRSRTTRALTAREVFEITIYPPR